MAKMPHYYPDAIIKQFLCECKLNSVKESPVKVTTSSIFVFFLNRFSTFAMQRFELYVFVCDQFLKPK